MTRIFVTGTGTNVGKTWVAAWITRSWGAAYWKPVQSGSPLDADLVRRVAPDCLIYPSRHSFPDPLSPDQAAKRVGVSLSLADFVLPTHAGPLVVEGAGGILVPLNQQTLMVDLMARLALPILLVAGSGLGTINHTLLSLAALRDRALPVAGIIMVGPPHAENRAAIEHFGGVAVVAELPPLADPDALARHPPLTWRP